MILPRQKVRLELPTSSAIPWPRLCIFCGQLNQNWPCMKHREKERTQIHMGISSKLPLERRSMLHKGENINIHNYLSDMWHVIVETALSCLSPGYKHVNKRQTKANITTNTGNTDRRSFYLVGASRRTASQSRGQNSCASGMFSWMELCRYVTCAAYTCRTTVMWPLRKTARGYLPGAMNYFTNVHCL